MLLNLLESSMKHKIGIVGYGHMGKNHARVVEKIENLELVGIFDINHSALRSLTYPVYEILDNLLDKCDTVIISSSTTSHFEIFEYCIKKNKNILIEKPISTNLKELNEIEKMVNKTSKFVKIGLLEKYNPVINYLQTQNLSDIEYINIQRLSPSNQKNRNQENVLLDLSIHDFSILRVILDKNFDEIDFNFYFKNNSPSEHVDIVGTTDKINIVINTSKIYQKKVRKIEILTNTSLFKGNLITNSVEIIHSKNIEVLDSKKSFGHIENATTIYPNLEVTEPLYSQISSFIYDITNNQLENSKNIFYEDINLHKFLISKI